MNNAEAKRVMELENVTRECIEALKPLDVQITTLRQEIERCTAAMNAAKERAGDSRTQRKRRKRDSSVAMFGKSTDEIIAERQRERAWVDKEQREIDRLRTEMRPLQQCVSAT